MTTKKQIDDEVENIINSFDNDDELTPNPFLAEKVLHQFRNQKSSADYFSVIYSKLNYAAIVILLLINIATVVFYIASANKTSVHNKLVSALSVEYQIDSTDDSF